VSRRAVIRNRRFFWRYEDGRVEPVRLTEGQLAHLRQSTYQLQVAQQRAERHVAQR
jgi:hypothetical protein